MKKTEQITKNSRIVKHSSTQYSGYLRNPKNNPNKIKIGEYRIGINEKGKDETIVVPPNEIYYMIRLDKYTYLDTPSQDNAEIITRLIRIENQLKKTRK